MDYKSYVYWKFVYPIIIRVDSYKGLDFLPIITAKAVGLDIKRSFGYSPSHKRFLIEVLSDFNIISQDAIIDVGCGKGSAMRTMLMFPFAKVDGIELSTQIADIATRNFNQLKEDRCTVFTGDAGQYRDYDAYNYVYFFNPFPDVVMAEVVENLMESVHRSDRELIIIYMSPTCTDVIEESALFKLKGIYKRAGAWVTVYSNRSIEKSKLFSNTLMLSCIEGSTINNELKLYLENFTQPDYIDIIK